MRAKRDPKADVGLRGGLSAPQTGIALQCQPPRGYLRHVEGLSLKGYAA